VLAHRSSGASWGRLGEVLLAHTFDVEANICFEEAERLDPHEAAWPYLRGFNLVAHDPDTGIRCLERAVANSPGRTEPRLYLAEVLVERGRLDEAQSLFQAVIRGEPDNPRARLGLGRLALLHEDWRGALEHLDPYRLDPHTRKRAATARAEAWDRLGEPENARAERDRAAKLPADQTWPDQFHDRVTVLRRGLQARFQVAASLLQSGQLESAVQVLQQTQEKYPDSVEACMRLSDVWLRANKPDRALACSQRAVQVAPEMAEAWARLGSLQALLHMPEAVDNLQEAIRLKPDHAQAHFNLGQCFLRDRGDRSRAAEQFRAALQCNPDYDSARQALRDLEARRP
jgi:tetratricopeptide (TPR) repeat protein